MPVHDRAADGEPHAKSAWLRRVERVEQAGRLRLAEADAGIFHRDDRPGAIVTLFEGRAHDQPAPLRRDVSDRLGSIHDQVQENLLELDPIAHDSRQVGRQRRIRNSSVARALLTYLNKYLAADTCIVIL